MRTLLISICAGWFLAAGCARPASAPARPETGETWMSTWLRGQKIGYTVLRYTGSGAGYRFESVMKMEIAMAGITQRVSTRHVAVTGSDLTLRSFDFRFESRDRVMSAEGAVQGNELVVRGRGDKPRVIKLDGPVYPMPALGILAVRRFAAGDSAFEVPVFDATLMSMTRVKVAFEGRDSVTVGGERVGALKVRTEMAGFPIETWLDEDGMALREESPPGMTSERTTPEEAVAAVRGGELDLLKMFRVAVDTVVPNPEAVRRVTYELTGVGDELQLDYDNQEVVSTDPFVLGITVPDLPAGTVPLPVPGQAEFLKPSLEVQCDDPALVAKAREAVGSPEDAVAGARTLVSWVFTALDKEPTASFPTALDVLKHMKGDCNEHAVFFAALARASGIPTKVAVGLVYMEGAFYYHAWNEVFLGRWVPVDATFGEFPASALHIKMREGGLSEQARILAAVGRIGIRIRSFE